MTGRLILLLLLTPLQQDPKKADDETERARRAAIVDRIMAEPIRPRVVRAAPPDLPPPMPVPAPVVMRDVNAMKRMTLELREVAAPEDVEEAPQFNPRAMVGLNLQELALSRENFDRWLFEDTLNEGARKNRLDALLSDKIRSVEKGRAIEAEGLRKLRLAGNGDIKRYLDRVQAARVDFETTRQDFNAGRNALGQLEPLASEYRVGPFGPDSIFEKTLRKIEDDRKSAESGSK